MICMKPLDSTSWFLGCQCPPGPWRCALQGAAGRKCPWWSWGRKGKSWIIIEIMENHRTWWKNHGTIMETSWEIMENHGKIINGKEPMENHGRYWFLFKPIAGFRRIWFSPISHSETTFSQATSPRLALGKARAAFAVPWPRECPGFHGPTHEPKIRGLKNDRLNHQNYIKISFKYKSSRVPRKRKPCWILGLQIF